MKKVDAVVSLVIGELAALLMLVIGRNLALPGAVRAYLGWLPFVFPLLTFTVMLVGTVLGRRAAFVYQFSKFLLVGGMNFLIDLGVLNFLIYLTGITAGFYAASFKAMAFLVAVGSSFLWNKFWTFRALSVEHVGAQFAEFFAVTAVGFLINVGSFALLNDFVGPQAPFVLALTGQSGIDPTTWASISAGGAAIAGLIWNFLGYKFFVFRRTRI